MTEVSKKLSMKEKRPPPQERISYRFLSKKLAEPIPFRAGHGFKDFRSNLLKKLFFNKKKLFLCSDKKVLVWMYNE